MKTMETAKTDFYKTLEHYTTKFQAVRNSPVSFLKTLPTEQLECFMEEMKKENRQCLSALHWLEGIIKLRKENKNDE